MAIECLVITFILGAIVFSFARADRIRWVIATVPLGILPLANCVSCFVCTAFLGCELPNNIAAVILLLAVMASSRDFTKPANTSASSPTFMTITTKKSKHIFAANK